MVKRIKEDVCQLVNDCHDYEERGVWEWLKGKQKQNN